MKIENKNPPLNIRQRCDKAFNLTDTVPIFTFGDTIYNPSGVVIDDFLASHEQVHAIQQGNKPAIWWARYINDKNFRFDQELAAYRVQYRVMRDLVKDRNLLAKMLHAIASDLAGPMYGSMCGVNEAKKLIKEGI